MLQRRHICQCTGFSVCCQNTLNVYVDSLSGERAGGVERQGGGTRGEREREGLSVQI